MLTTIVTGFCLTIMSPLTDFVYGTAASPDGYTLVWNVITVVGACSCYGDKMILEEYFDRSET